MLSDVVGVPTPICADPLPLPVREGGAFDLTAPLPAGCASVGEVMFPPAPGLLLASLVESVRRRCGCCSGFILLPSSGDVVVDAPLLGLGLEPLLLATPFAMLEISASIELSSS
jgi:hypothetical protein